MDAISLDKKKHFHLLADRAEKLNELKQHPSWRLLVEIFEKRRDKHFAHFARTLMSGRDVVDQRKLDFDRGFWAGAAWIVDNPEKAQETFEKAIRKAEAFGGEE